MYYNNKIIVSGSEVEFLEYERPCYMKGDYLVIRENSTSQILRLRRLISANLSARSADGLRSGYSPLFLTLTFKEQNLTNLTVVRRALRDFLRKFKDHYEALFGEKLKYVAVMEFTKKKNPHFHVLFFNMRFVPNLFEDLKKMWVYGYSLFKVVSVKNSANLAGYMGKYLTKQKNDSSFHSYMCSKGLIRPYVILNSEAVTSYYNMFLSFRKALYTSIYDSKYNGKVYYRRYSVVEDDSVYWEALKKYWGNPVDSTSVS